MYHPDSLTPRAFAHRGPDGMRRTMSVLVDAGIPLNNRFSLLDMLPNTEASFDVSAPAVEVSDAAIRNKRRSTEDSGSLKQDPTVPVRSKLIVKKVKIGRDPTDTDTVPGVSTDGVVPTSTATETFEPAKDGFITPLIAKVASLESPLCFAPQMSVISERLIPRSCILTLSEPPVRSYHGCSSPVWVLLLLTLSQDKRQSDSSLLSLWEELKLFSMCPLPLRKTQKQFKEFPQNTQMRILKST